MPDLLGYGQTDKPDDPTEYSFKKLSRDLASILDQVVGRNSQAVSADFVKPMKITG